MESIFNTLANSLTPFLSFLLLSIIVFVWFFKEQLFSYLISGKFNLKSNLENHDLFSVIEKMIKVEIYNVNFEDDPTKSDVFKDFMKIKLAEIDEQSSKLISKRVLKMNSQELTSFVKSLVTDIVHNYNTKSVRKFKSKGLTSEQVDVIMRIFDKWHNGTLDAVNSRIGNVLSGSYHRTNHQKVVAVFEILAMSVELSMTDGIKGFEELNGYFKSIDYGER